MHTHMLCVYVCMHMCIHTYVCVYDNIYIYIYMYTRTLYCIWKISIWTNCTASTKVAPHRYCCATSGGTLCMQRAQAYWVVQSGCAAWATTRPWAHNCPQGNAHNSAHTLRAQPPAQSLFSRLCSDTMQRIYNDVTIWGNTWEVHVFLSSHLFLCFLRLAEIKLFIFVEMFSA